MLEGCKLLDKFMENDIKFLHTKKETAYITTQQEYNRLFFTTDELAEFFRQEWGKEDDIWLKDSDDFIIQCAWDSHDFDEIEYTPWIEDWNLLMEVVNKLIEVYGIHVLKHYHRGAVSKLETFTEAIRRIKKLYENGAIN